MAEAAKAAAGEGLKIPASMFADVPGDTLVPPTTAERMNMKLPSRISNLQKAAILLITISQEDPKLVSEIYRKLNKKYLRFIIQEVSKLNFVDQRTNGEVIREFYDVFIEKTQLFGGKQVATDMIQNIFSEDDAQRFFFERKDRFKLLADLPVSELFLFLSEEHPQFTALVLSSIDAEKAGEIMALFNDKDRVDITKRMLNLEQPLMSVGDLERAIENHFSKREMASMGEQVNIQKVATILEDINETDRINIIHAIEAEYPSKVKKMKKLLFTFGDLRFLPDNYLQYILSEIRDIQVLATALKGSDKQLVEKLQVNMSARMRDMLSEEIELLSDEITAKNVEEARKMIVGFAKMFALERNMVLSDLLPEDTGVNNGVTR